MRSYNNNNNNNTEYSTQYQRVYNDDMYGSADPGTVVTPALRHARLSALDREGDILDKSKTEGSAWTAFAFTVNFIFGAGVLSIPYSVAHAGIVGSCIFMAFTAFVSGISMIWLVEVCGRAEGLLRSREEDQLRSPTLKTFGSREENQGVSAFRISKRRLEVNELTQLILGTIPNYIYTASVTCFCVSSMWFYGVIFALSFTQTLPLPFYPDTYHTWYQGSTCNFNNGLNSIGEGCRETYTIYLGFFIVLTMFAACFDLADQKKLQAFFTILAMTCIMCMLITLGVSISLHPYEGEQPSSPSHSGTNHSVHPFPHHGGGSDELPGYQKVPFWFDINGFSTAFMNFIFAFLAHQGVPGLVQLLGDKSKAPQVFLGALGTACTVYMALGGIAAYYFGMDPHYGIQKLITLNWRNYNGTEDPKSSGNVVTIFISYVVRLYPVVSVTSAFTLYADTVGNSARAMLCPSKSYKHGGKKCLSEAKMKVFSRWIFIWLSCLGASLLVDITVIVNVCGLLGVILVMVIPGFLQLKSKQLCEEEFGRSETPFSWHFSNNCYVYIILVIAVVGSVYALVNLLM